MIHVFHGFLGSPSDFSFLSGKDVILHDLYEAKEPSLSEDDILIGYSMGGRIALELADKYKFHFKKLVLINAHPGLTSAEERTHRMAFEEKVVESLKTKSKEEFLSWWNSLPIFSHDKPLAIKEEKRFQSAAELFENHRLSDQKNYLPLLSMNKDKVLYIVGLLDEKYMDLATDVLLPEEIHVKGVPGGHRLYQSPEELIKVLKEENVL